jgi:hypothetical protein
MPDIAIEILAPICSLSGEGRGYIVYFIRKIVQNGV